MISLAHFETLAGSMAIPGHAVIDGKVVPALSGKTFANVSPRNGAVINQVAEADGADIDVAVAAARRAFEEGTWRRMHYRQKKKILF